jgi:hypothetical protein
MQNSKTSYDDERVKRGTSMVRSQSNLMRPLEGGESVEQSETSISKDDLGGLRKPPKDINLKKKTTRAVSKGPAGLPFTTIKNKRLQVNAQSNLS